MSLYKDIKDIFRKDFKLFLIVNFIYFGMVIVGAVVALMYPGMQLAMVESAGQTFGSGSPLGSVGEAYGTGNIPMAALLTFVTNFFLGTLAALTVPSLIIPFWALLMGAYRALLWGVMLIIPIPGLLPLGVLGPHYLTILLEGEAYIVAIFGCTRGLMALLKPGSFGTGSRRQAYWKAIKDNGKLLLVVALLLAVAAVYEAWEVTYFVGLLGGTASIGQFGFYDQEFGANSTYSNWTQTIPVNTSAWSSFPLVAGKLTRAQMVTNGTPIDVMVMDRDNFTIFNANPDSPDWSPDLMKKNIVNETFDFTPTKDGNYWFVMRNQGDKDSGIHMQVRSRK